MTTTVPKQTLIDTDPLVRLVDSPETITQTVQDGSNLPQLVILRQRIVVVAEVEVRSDGVEAVTGHDLPNEGRFEDLVSSPVHVVGWQPHVAHVNTKPQIILKLRLVHIYPILHVT